VRVRAVIEGIVQGVGFRPFIYRLAQEKKLSGLVTNEGRGVSLEVQGQTEAVEAFFKDLLPRKPPLAHIVRVTRSQIEPRKENSFRIIASQAASCPTALVPPDVALCDQCQAELFDPQDRRFGYPFINCTNCGPRYTIIQGLPYDRPLTTMASFEMCPDCLAEYQDPADRRFHAQPNACPVCGPRAWLTDNQGRTLAGDPLALAGQKLKEGLIVAIKGLGGFHLACDAANQEAVSALRRRKKRKEKPLALMVRDLAAAKRLVLLSQAEEELLTSPLRPILIADQRPGAEVAPAVAPGLNQLGVMMAYTPLHHLVLAQGPEVLVMTSGNLSDEPIAVDNQEALARLKEVADFFLLHDRQIYTRADDSVAMSVLDQPRVVRRARGYVPRPVFLNRPGPNVLALGPELKNTVCLTRGSQAFLSAHVGDLKDAETLAYFEQTLDRLQELLKIKPQALAVDLHPDYLSTRQAETWSGLPIIKVQHHAAHILSAVAELGLEGPVIGLALDGTGFGLDGSVWGGEVLLVSDQGFRRLGRISPFRLPGGDKAVRQPWRTACGLLGLTFGPDWARHLPRWLAGLGRPEMIETLEKMMDQGLNSPFCSSAGRLFDGLAGLVGFKFETAYEGQAAIEFEGALDETETGSYDLEVGWRRFGSQGLEMIDLDPRPLIKEALADAAQDSSPAVISARFHRGLARALARAASLAAERTGLRQVVMSGGCFMNRHLLIDLSQRLEGLDLEPLSQRDVPTNDGGISLGQALGTRLALSAGQPEMWAREMRD